MLLVLITAIMLSMAACNKSGNASKDSSASSVSYGEMADSGEISASAEKTASGGSGSFSLSTMDKFLNDYENFLDDYIKVMDKIGPLYKRMMTGDMTAIAEIEKYQPMLDDFGKKYEDFGEKYEKYTPSAFTPAQLKKWEQISTKYANALTDALGQ